MQTNSSTANSNQTIVSDDSELLVLVDSQDNPLGHLDKRACHDGAGVLHRAFSLFVFNDAGEMLMQQRAQDKRLWPGFWSNSCCSHPRQGEDLMDAVQRRSEQELGICVDPKFLYKFEYQANFQGQGSEHELCSVFCARYNGEVNVNRTEIMAWQWLAPHDLDTAIHQAPDTFTPWFKMEWERLKQDFAGEIGL